MSDNLYNKVDKVHLCNTHKRPQTFSWGEQKVVGAGGEGQKDTICLNKCYGINLGINYIQS